MEAAVAVWRRLVRRVAAAVRRAALWVAHAMDAYGGAAVVPNDSDSDSGDCCADDTETGQYGSVARGAEETGAADESDRQSAAPAVMTLGSRLSRAARRAGEKLAEARDRTRARLCDRISERRALRRPQC